MRGPRVTNHFRRKGIATSADRHRHASADPSLLGVEAAMTAGDVTPRVPNLVSCHTALKKPPGKRTEAEVSLLQRRTVTLDYCRELSPEAHKQLVRTVTFRKLAAGARLLEKGRPADKVCIVLSGTVHVYATTAPARLARRRSTGELSPHNKVFSRRLSVFASCLVADSSAANW